MKKSNNRINLKKINNFWNWFIHNEKAIAAAFKNQINHEEVFDEMNQKLSLISKRLGVILIEKRDNPDKTVLIFTTEGYKSVNAKVEALVNQAPLIYKWEFEDFLNPRKYDESNLKELEKPIIYQDIELKTSELYFEPLEMNTRNKKMKILVYTKNYKYQCNNENLEKAISIIICRLIGEYKYKRSIALIQLAQMPNFPKNLIHLYELDDYIDFLNDLNRKVKIII